MNTLLTRSEPERVELDLMFSAVYDELREMASQIMRSNPPARTLQPTVLVHEAYLRLMQDKKQQWVNRAHFFGAAAEAMRRILIEDARRKKTLRRGGNCVQVPLENVQVATDASPELLLMLDGCLDRLAAEHPLRVEVVKLMFYAGLTVKEAAQTLGLSERTIKRHWAFARAWLYDAITNND